MDQSEEEVLSFKGQNAKTLGKVMKLQDVFDDQARQLRDKEGEMNHLTNRITELHSVMQRQDCLANHRKNKINNLETRASSDQQLIAQLNTKNPQIESRNLIK